MSNPGTNSSKNAEVKVKVKKNTKGVESTGVWHIKNWKANYNLIKNYVTCTTEVEIAPCTPSTLLSFSFQETQELSSNNSEIKSWLSLCVTMLRGKSPSAFSINVDALDENFFVTQNLVPAVRIAFNSYLGEPKKTELVVSNFILAKTTQSGIEGEEKNEQIHVDKELRLRISVTPLFFGNDNPKLASSGDDENAALAKNLKDMFESQINYPDVELETGDLVIIPGHKFLLGARSPYLRTLFETHMQNISGFAIKLWPLKGTAAVHVWKWMYTGELDESAYSIVKDIAHAAKYLELDRLLNVLDRNLIIYCNDRNMLHLMDVAKNFNLMKAESDISAYIHTHDFASLTLMNYVKQQGLETGKDDVKKKLRTKK